MKPPYPTPAQRSGVPAAGSAPAAALTPREDHQQHLEAIRASHARCLDLGLVPRDQLDFSRQALADIRLAQERCARLQAQALPVMEMLLDQVSGSGQVVCLADDKGTILLSAGRGASLEFAERVALRPGVSWAESAKGTNAVGTALVTESDVFVHAQEHYLESNHGLTCSASPIMDHSGSVIGVLDLTGEPHSFHPHTLALVRMAARTIEHYWFCDHFSRHLRLHFQLRPERIGTLAEGVMALDAEGRVLGVNRAGLQLLGCSGAALRIQGLRMLFGLSFGELMDRLRSGAAQAPLPLRLPDGRLLFVRAHDSEAHGGQSFALGSRHTRGAPGTQLPHRPAPEAAPAPRPEALGTGAAPASPASPELDQLARGDARMGQVVDQIRRVLDRDIPVLILGETGTGKDVLANALHRASQRRQQAFVAVNCASIPESLIESELFGYEEGAFTGAKRRGSPGKLVQAHGGTLFLDEIGDMPLALQARLLRVLQERKVVPLGGHKAQEVDLALVCATHRNLHEMIDSGRFREDLYYRINGLAVRLPALCERSDLRELCRQLIRQFAPDRPLTLSDALMADFLAYPWPGNLRQLHNVLRTACVMAGTDSQLTRVHLPLDFAEELAGHGPARPAAGASAAGADPGEAGRATPPASLGEALHELKLSAIRQTLRRCQGNVSEAAKQLNISRNTIYRKLRAAGLEPARGPAPAQPPGENQ